jgi:hypothetical protein
MIREENPNQIEPVYLLVKTGGMFFMQKVANLGLEHAVSGGLLTKYLVQSPTYLSFLPFT